MYQFASTRMARFGKTTGRRQRLAPAVTPSVRARADAALQQPTTSNLEVFFEMGVCTNCCAGWQNGLTPRRAAGDSYGVVPLPRKHSASPCCHRSPFRRRHRPRRLVRALRQVRLLGRCMAQCRRQECPSLQVTSRCRGSSSTRRARPCSTSSHFTRWPTVSDVCYCIAVGDIAILLCWLTRLCND